MHRREVLALALGVAFLPTTGSFAASKPLRSIVVLDFDVIEDHPDPTRFPELQRRTQEAHLQLQRALREQELYQVLELAPAQELLASLRNQQEFMHRCDECVRQIGEKLKSDLVMTTWVQKVSELILNINIEVHDLERQRVVLSKSVDLRGNNDQSWQRSIRFLVRDMAEKRKENPSYGL